MQPEMNSLGRFLGGTIDETDTCGRLSHLFMVVKPTPAFFAFAPYLAREHGDLRNILRGLMDQKKTTSPFLKSAKPFLDRQFEAHARSMVSADPSAVSTGLEGSSQTEGCGSHVDFPAQEPEIGAPPQIGGDYLFTPSGSRQPQEVTQHNPSLV